ncbi:MAG: hypothetical protein M3O31_09220 [Acidobacteriota bacterium]|nr:hypothetical protein [Acidobacteriota bacterium]
MPITVALAIGFDPWLFEIERTVSQTAGYFVTPASSVDEGMERFMCGDFDLVLLGPFLPVESRERLTQMIRATGSSIPVICLNRASGHGKASGHAANLNEPTALLQLVRKCLATRPERAA